MGNVVFTVYISIALIFLIYSIISCKKKRIIYTIRNKRINVSKDNYYNLQLLFCIANCILLILESVIAYNKTSTSLFVSYYLATFWLVNYLLKFIGIKMKYLNTNYK
ncbi:hypothetical protein [Romboutsia sp. 1001713B170207_170306_H8]|uniref:hypothetical protein n=1 Tax=Romboutsia sp. 1001713B170207_170306_H8 TaxID=2787112 RepID=UPI00082025A2|nr:hypothetical protein [Romboutsia sp. 1001713B170207_170306_H8]SCH45488.1 Uncharacterised protein [uncultured Clostridium sp.]